METQKERIERKKKKTEEVADDKLGAFNLMLCGF